MADASIAEWAGARPTVDWQLHRPATIGVTSTKVGFVHYWLLAMRWGERP
jgi:hypothetical protein